MPDADQKNLTGLERIRNPRTAPPASLMANEWTVITVKRTSTPNGRKAARVASVRTIRPVARLAGAHRADRSLAIGATD